MRKISKEMVEKYIMNNDMTVMPAGEYEAGIVFPANMIFPAGCRIGEGSTFAGFVIFSNGRKVIMVYKSQVCK